MSKKRNIIREVQRSIIQASDKTIEISKAGSEKVAKSISNASERIGINEVASIIVTESSKKAKDLDKRIGLSTKTEKAIEIIGEESKKVQEYTKIKYEGSPLERATNKTSHFVNRHIIRTAHEYLDKTGINKGVRQTLDLLERSWGYSRSIVKPYFSPETPQELLIETKDELTYIISCILQVSHSDAEKWADRLGKAVVSKIAGVASAGALLSLVSTFGTAGTGAAISGLSGAAATSSTLAWVGSLLGGGMATGAAITGGITIIVGVVAYKTLGSEARQYEDLTLEERQIVESCGIIVAAINDLLNDKGKSFDVEDAQILLENTLKPLYSVMQENSERICQNLDTKNAVAFRQHALLDFKLAVLDKFDEFIEENRGIKVKNYEFVIAGVLYSLLTRSVVNDDEDSQLVLDAIRRSDPDLANSPEGEISEYLDKYDADQLRGIMNNVKGIYHEMLFVKQYNESHSDTHAEIYDNPYQPIADVKIIDKESGDVIETIQLKATNSKSYATAAEEKDPDTEVWVTTEVAERSPTLDSTNISNEEIAGKVSSDIEELADNSTLDRVTEVAGLSGIAAAGREAINVLNGKSTASEGATDAIKSMSAAAASTYIATFLFG